MTAKTYRYQALSCLLIWLIAGVGAPGGACATRPLQGHVNMQGSIIDTPCAIDMASQRQLIQMPPTTLGQIVQYGQGPAVPFSIELVACSLTAEKPTQSGWSQFQITFDGAVTQGGLFGVTGEAKGVGLQITDISGVTVKPGKPLPPGGLQPGRMRLDYSLQLRSNQQVPHAGNYHTTLRFKLDYF